jgi:hypothetical protein
VGEPARVGQPLDDEHHGAFAPPGAVGARRERLAAAVRGERPWRLSSTKIPGLGITVTPPASANEHSPRARPGRRGACAVNDEEHAVSTVRPGPRARRCRRSARTRRSWWSRSAGTPRTRRAPGRGGGRSPGASRRRTHRCGSRAGSPGSTPARSNASHAISSSTRCCGSIAAASRGLIPKNSASNWSASCRNPPSRT